MAGEAVAEAMGEEAAEVAVVVEMAVDAVVVVVEVAEEAAEVEAGTEGQNLEAKSLIALISLFPILSSRTDSTHFLLPLLDERGHSSNDAFDISL